MSGGQPAAVLTDGEAAHLARRAGARLKMKASPESYETSRIMKNHVTKNPRTLYIAIHNRPSHRASIITTDTFNAQDVQLIHKMAYDAKHPGRESNITCVCVDRSMITKHTQQYSMPGHFHSLFSRAPPGEVTIATFQSQAVEAVLRSIRRTSGSPVPHSRYWNGAGADATTYSRDGRRETESGTFPLGRQGTGWEMGRPSVPNFEDLGGKPHLEEVLL